MYGLQCCLRRMVTCVHAQVTTCCCYACVAQGLAAAFESPSVMVDNIPPHCDVHKHSACQSVAHAVYPRDLVVQTTMPAYATGVAIAVAVTGLIAHSPLATAAWTATNACKCIELITLTRLLLVVSGVAIRVTTPQCLWGSLSVPFMSRFLRPSTQPTPAKC